MCLIDIVFILDSSESAKNQLFDIQKNFVLNLTDSIFQMKPVKSQKYNVKLASMQFSSTVSIDHPFTAWKNVQNFKEKIKSLGFIGHGTYSYYAISNATQLFKTEGRKRSSKVAFLMTDGVDHPNSPNVQGIATAARSLGIHFFTIGLSKKNVQEEKLRMISGDSSSKHVLCLDDQNLIADVALELVKPIFENHGCKGSCVLRLLEESLLCLWELGVIQPREQDLSCGIRCRITPLELVFVIDSSESVGPDNFNIIKTFMKTVIDKVSANHVTTRIGIINFSHKVQLVSSLKQYTTKEHLKSAVDKMPYFGEGTYTASAIQKAIQLFQAARPAVRKVAVVITDGQADSRDKVQLNTVVRELASSFPHSPFVLETIPERCRFPSTLMQHLCLLLSLFHIALVSLGVPQSSLTSTLLGFFS
uniref:VWFA domain-containing protein n=1 Tax=Athene cunicularia TaxID=194338 RepID=A0A663LQ10_ATHCN